jgi:hypothetical protein
VPTSHCPEARWQDNPGAAATPSRAAVMRGDRAAISDADGHTGGGKGIPRALMRNTTITRLPRSIATAFPSATRGRCVHERDRRFESVSLQRGVCKLSVPRRVAADRNRDLGRHRLLAQQLKDLSLLGLDFSLEITGFEMGEINLRASAKIAEPVVVRKTSSSLSSGVALVLVIGTRGTHGTRLHACECRGPHQLVRSPASF